MRGNRDLPGPSAGNSLAQNIDKYRKGRKTADALTKIWREVEAGNEWIVDADLKDFFGSVNHPVFRNYRSLGNFPPSPHHNIHANPGRTSCSELGRRGLRVDLMFISPSDVSPPATRSARLKTARPRGSRHRYKPPGADRVASARR